MDAAESPAPPEPAAGRGRPHRDDVLLAAAGLAGGLLLWSLGLYTLGRPDHDPGMLPLLPLAVMAVTELLRRVAQPGALLVASGALVADFVIGSNLATVLMFTDVIYAAVLYGPERTYRRVLPVSVIVTASVAVWAVATFRTAESLLIGVVGALVSVGPAWTGLVLRQHRRAADAERLRAEQTALLAEMDRREAVTAERGRMARELHDMVANHLSAIAIHSTAAQSLKDPAATEEALGVIRENSVQGLAEMRRLIGLLRDTGGEDHRDAEPAAAPTLDGLDALLEQFRANGTRSGLEFTAEDEREPGTRLPAPVELAAYRIVQESLTNALKHATPGTVAVRLAGTDGGAALQVRVTSPYGASAGPRAPGSGAGLVGMRERVALLGGTFEAGPVTADGPGGKTAREEREEQPEQPEQPARQEQQARQETVWQVRAVLPAGEEGQR
ncbi:sensor histidine kinase [Streptomyces sp. Ru87]|uniref:sensor histidine kinase n=1 Tax=Streptomyces sp. Ru87 TaxID=2044307 RepID=UPI000D1FAEDC|nr:histidine kinase [Streptomyces sp. Ru87]